MNRRTTPMPDSLRHYLRAGQNPARAVECPHCGAHEHKPCRVRATDRLLPDVHPARRAAWAEQTARCPHCQALPGAPCHTSGLPLANSVHARRHLEAEETAA